MLFSHDRDYFRLNRRGVPHTGIAYTHQSTSISRVINGLMRIHETKTSEDMIGWLEYI